MTARSAAAEPGPVVVDGRGLIHQAVADALRNVDHAVVRQGRYAAQSARWVAEAGGELPAIVVFVRQRPVALDEALGWQELGVPHVSVAGWAHRVTVGPLFVPGRTGCPRCTLAPWEGEHEAGVDLRIGGAPLPVGGGLPVLAAALTTLVVSDVLHGGADLAGVRSEATLRPAALRHHYIAPLGHCECLATFARRMRDVGPDQATMAG